ncbi:MAG: hypothetical protein KF800_05170 [Lysobacter sp.]|nr:hypothetical protein [Lysobacter sp.]
MTHVYQWYSFPPAFSILCPRCGAEAIFTEEKGAFRHPPDTPIAGRSTCLSCGYNGSHAITWPDAAYNKAEVRGHVLWAWSAESTDVLIRFLASKERNEKDFPGHYAFLLHLPTVFKQAQMRDQAIAKLKKVLARE